MISVSPIGFAMSLGHERHSNRNSQSFGGPRERAKVSNALIGAGLAERARLEARSCIAAGKRESNAIDIGNTPLTAVAHAIALLRDDGIVATIDHVNYKLVLSW